MMTQTYNPPTLNSGAPTPEVALEIIGKECPTPGDGVNLWVARAACRLVEACVSDEDCESLIEGLMSRDPKRDEIKRALAYAHGERHSNMPRWPSADNAAIARATANGPAVEKLIERSPQSISLDGKSRSAEYIGALFPGNPWLCCGQSDRVFSTYRRCQWRAGVFGEKALIVPSPMSTQYGLTRDNPPKKSQHTLSNTGPRKYLVIEFDKATCNEQAALHWKLSQHGLLVCVVFSGSKSLHGWYDADGEPENEVKEFFSYAVSLGADPRTWLRSQFVRMPDGLRTDGKQKEFLGLPRGRQAVLYWNPPQITSNL
jgi:hypothetical protein